MSETGKKVAVGIDLGGTAVKIGILNAAYEILAQTSIPTDAGRPYQEVISYPLPEAHEPDSYSVSRLLLEKKTIHALAVRR